MRDGNELSLLTETCSGKVALVQLGLGQEVTMQISFDRDFYGTCDWLDCVRVSLSDY